MGWGNKFPDMKNDPSYLDPRLTAAEASLAQKAQQTDVTDRGINPKQAPYNAKFDAVTDDTTAIQNAINDLPSGGVLILPKGTAKLTAPILLKNNIKITGSGRYTTTLNWNGSSDGFQIPASGQGITIEGMGLTSLNKTNTAIKSLATDVSQKNHEVLFKDLYFKYWNIGLDFEFYTRSWVNTCYSYGNNVGFYAYESVNNEWANLHSLSDVTGMQLRRNTSASAGLGIVNCTVVGCSGIGVDLTYEAVQMSGCVIDSMTGNGGALSVNNGSYANVFTNNWFGTVPNAYAVTLYGINNIFSNNSVPLSYRGVYVSGGSNIISNNQMWGNSLYDINIASASNCLIEGNICNSSLGTSIGETGTSDGNTFSLNKCHGQIISLGSSSTKYFNDATNLPRIAYSGSTPSAGNWKVGDIVYNTAPTAGGSIGWSCVTTGTFGTLSGVTGTTTAGTTTFTVNTATGLSLGQYINIAGVTGTYKILAISGTTITVDNNINTTVSSASVSYAPPVFKTFGAISA